MTQNIPKILICGRNFHARAAFRKLNSNPWKWNVIGFIEKDETGEINNFFEKPIFAIFEINQIDFDLIVIAGRYTNEMKDVLINSGISHEKIWEMKRSEFQPSAQDLQLREDATMAYLKTLLEIFSQNSVDHWFVASSLLAFKRGQNLAWFADVDIAIHQERLEEIASAIQDSDLFHSIEICRHATDGKFWCAGEIYQIVINSLADSIKYEPAVIDIHALHLFDNKAYLNIADRSFLTVDGAHFKGANKMKYNNLQLNIPIAEEQFLETTYGNQWQTPAEFFNTNDHISRIDLNHTEK
jgi:hypothetical protein